MRPETTGIVPGASAWPADPGQARERRHARDRLDVRLLGGVSAVWRGSAVQPTSRGSTALLAVIALQRLPRSRETIAVDLWPEAGAATSATWLRQALWQLRRAFAGAGADPDRLLEVDADRIGLGPDVELDLDTTRFEALLSARPPRPEEALALYHGELAEGLSHDCFVRDRERLTDLYEDALADVGARCLLEGDLECARGAALRLVHRDPLREEAHATLIEVYGRTGSRSQVSRQYRRLTRILARELGVEPLAETEQSYRAAMRTTSDRSAARATARGLS